LLDAADQRALDMVDLVEPLGLVEIDDQVHAGTAHAVPDHEMIVDELLREGIFAWNFGAARHKGRAIFLSGGAWCPQARPRLEEGVFAHGVLPNQRSNPRPANRLTETKSSGRRPVPAEAT